MKIEKIKIKSCCSGEIVLFKLDRSINANLLDHFKQAGYQEAPSFTKSGILYVDNIDITVTGTFGGNKLQLKCRNNNCSQAMDNLETFLQSI